jgi:mono/diheme cytochrome c family protein
MSDAEPTNKLYPATPAPQGPVADAGRLSDEELQAVHAERFDEKEEPAVGFSPVPVFMIMLFTALTFWTALYIGNNAGGFHWNVYDANWRPGSEQGTQGPPDLMKIGARVFKNSCQQCHGPEGKGVPGTYPPLAGSTWVVGPPDRPVSVVLAGLSGAGTIMDNNYSGSMPALGISLKDQEIAAVLTFVRQSWGNTGTPVDEADVTQLRASLGTRSSFTPAELLQHYPLGTPGVAPTANTPAAPGTPATTGAVPAGAPAGNITPAAVGTTTATPAAK